MTLGVSLLSALLLSSANGCDPEVAAREALPPTQPVAAYTQLTQVLICPKLRIQYQPGTYIWMCDGHPRSQSNPSLFDCSQSQTTMFSDPQKYGECVDGEGTGGCFEYGSSLLREEEQGEAPPSFRLSREHNPDAAYSAFELPPHANAHVTHWPAEESTPGALVQVEAPDGTAFCHLKVFDLKLRLERPGSKASCSETACIGFEVSDPGREPDAIVRLSALQTATDARTGLTCDGLYRIKLVNQDYVVRMMRRLPDET